MNEVGVVPFYARHLTVTPVGPSIVRLMLFRFKLHFRHCRLGPMTKDHLMLLQHRPTPGLSFKNKTWPNLCLKVSS